MCQESFPEMSCEDTGKLVTKKVNFPLGATSAFTITFLIISVIINVIFVTIFFFNKKMLCFKVDFNLNKSFYL